MFKISSDNKFTDAIKKLSIIEILLIQICLFYCFVFLDIVYTTNHSLILLDCISEGKIRSFYSIVTQRYGASAYYDFAIYLIFAVWNLPLWLVKGPDFPDPLSCTLGMVWAKTIVLFFSAVCLLYMYKIIKLSGKNDKYDLLFFFSTDILITVALCLMGQYDVIPLSLMLAGLYFYLTGQSNKFIIAFAIAIPIKAFALLLFCPLLLQKEKNLIKITLKIIISLIPILILRQLVPFSANQTGSNVSLLLWKFLNISFGTSNGRVGLFVVGYIILIAYCYIHTFKDSLYGSIITAIFVFAIMSLLGIPNPQWWVYIAVFIVLFISLNNNGSNVVLQLLATVGESMVFLQLVYTFKDVFNPVNIGFGILKRLVPANYSYGQAIADMTNMYKAAFAKVSINPDSVLEIAFSLGFACICLFVFLCCNTKYINNEQINSKINIVSIYSLRFVSVICLYMLMFLQLKYILP